MSNWSESAEVANASILQFLGDTITYTPKTLPVFTFTAVVSQGFHFEQQHAREGIHASLGSVQYSDISKALAPGELDLTTLQGDTCTFGNNSFVYRVQEVENPDEAGTLTIYLRKLQFES